MSIRVSTYVAKESPVHACSAGVKILLLLTYSIGIFFVETWWGIAGFAALSFMAAFASRIDLRLYLKPLVPVYFIMAFTIAFNWVLPGLFYASRIFLLAFSSLIVCFTTTPTALTGALVKGLSPARRIGVSVEDVGTTLGLALRFMPLLAVEAQSIRDAQWARGADFDSKSPLKKAKAWAGAFIPLFVGLFRRADKLATAMDARCYGASQARTSLVAQRVGILDMAALAAGVVIVVSLGVFL